MPSPSSSHKRAALAVRRHYLPDQDRAATAIVRLLERASTETQPPAGGGSQIGHEGDAGVTSALEPGRGSAA